MSSVVTEHLWRCTTPVLHQNTKMGGLPQFWSDARRSLNVRLSRKPPRNAQCFRAHGMLTSAADVSSLGYQWVTRVDRRRVPVSRFARFDNYVLTDDRFGFSSVRSIPLVSIEMNAGGILGVPSVEIKLLCGLLGRADLCTRKKGAARYCLCVTRAFAASNSPSTSKDSLPNEERF
jgi:hypothetical protein